VEVLADDESGMTIEFSAADPAVAARLLLRLGRDAQLVDGSETGVALEELRARIVARYGGDQSPI
jgi:hypothetical protein